MDMTLGQSVYPATRRIKEKQTFYFKVKLDNPKVSHKT